MRHFLIFLSISSLLWVSTTAFARDKVRSSQRLKFLRNATGQDSSSSSFQAKVDAVLNTNADPARSVIAQQDAREANALLSTTLQTDYDLEYSVSPSKTTEEKNESLTDVRLRSRLDASEEKYTEMSQKTIAELLEEEEARRSESISSKIRITPETDEPESSLRPSLAYNPFYFKPADAHMFEEQKPIMISRLVQNGFLLEDAQTIVSGSSSVEDIVLLLMQEEDFTYGEALEVVQ